MCSLLNPKFLKFQQTSIGVCPLVHVKLLKPKSFYARKIVKTQI
jgi:hypothetical protein